VERLIPVGVPLTDDLYDELVVVFDGEERRVPIHLGRAAA